MPAADAINPVHAACRQIRLRLMIRSAIWSSGWAAVCLIGSVILLLILDRLIWSFLPDPWWLVGVLALLLAFVWGTVQALLRAPSESASAGMLDEQLQLNSRLRSALELEKTTEPAASGFVELVQRDATAVSSGLDIHGAVPAVDWKPWWNVAVVAAMYIAAGIWLPARVDRSSLLPPVESPKRALAEIDNTQETTDSLQQDEQTPDAIREQLAELEALREELEGGVSDSREAEARTAAQLEKLADSIDSESEQANRDAEAISQAAEQARNRARSDSEEWDQRVDDLARSLGEQDFDSAADQIDELSESIDQMTQEERDRVSQQLEELANAIEPDTLDSGSEPSEHDQVERSLSEGLRDQAQQVREPETERESPTQERDREQESANESNPEKEDDQVSPQADRQEDLAREDSGSQDEQGAESSENNQGKQQNQSGESNENQGQQGERQSSDERGEQQSSEQSDSQQSQDSGESQQEQEQSRDSEQSGSNESQNAQEGDRQENGQETQGERESGGEQGPERGAESDHGQDQQQGMRECPAGEEGGRSESVQEQLRRLSERQRRAQRDQHSSEQLREQARRLMESEGNESPPGQQGVAPQESESSEDGVNGVRSGSDSASDPTGQQPLDHTTVPVDATDARDIGQSQPVGKWYGSDNEPASPGRSSTTAQQFRRASEQAQRAIDEQQVPRRYRHLVKEVFQRVQERAESLEETGAAPLGQDAVPQSPTNQSSGSE